MLLTPENNSALLSVNNLAVEFIQDKKAQRVVEGVSFEIKKGETLALVGESGSGKSVTAHSILRLLPYPLAKHPAGNIYYAGQDLLKIPEQHLRKIRGNKISMIFQEPMTSLNPLHSIEKQIGEVLALHKGLSGREMDEIPVSKWGKILGELLDKQVAAFRRRGYDEAESRSLARTGILVVAELMGGKNWYFPKGEDLRVFLRDIEIARRANRDNIEALAREYRLTPRSIYRIILEQRRQGRLPFADAPDAAKAT